MLRYLIHAGTRKGKNSLFDKMPGWKEIMFSLFTKSNTVISLTSRPKIKNRDLPLQLQQPSLLQRLKRKTFIFFKIFFIIGTFLFIVIMSFGEGTHAKQALVNFSFADTWQATVALKRKIFNDKVEPEKRSGTPDK